jgi:hypothetical protein
MDAILKAADRLADKLFTWPGVALVLGVIGIVVFREELRGLIRRVTSFSVSKAGLNATSPQPQALPQNPSISAIGSSDFARRAAADVEPLVLDQRITGICAEFDSQGIATGNREEAFLQLLAAALTREGWARIYLFILGAQIQLLQRLNESPVGLSEADIRHFYESGVAREQEYYRAVPLEVWIGFLETTTLVNQYEGKYVITPYGRGFLKYIVAQRLPFDRPG